MTLAATTPLDVSVVLPMHDERDNLARLLEEIESVLTPLPLRFEVIVVDDGSRDGSGPLLKRLCTTRPWLRGIIFRRNCGQSAALDAGLRAVSGRLVVMLDADGQNDPADIPRMLDLMEREQCDFVAGRRADRKDGWVLRKFPSLIANSIIRLVTRTRLRDLGCSLKLIRRELVDDLQLCGEMHRFLGVLVEGSGATTVEMDVNHRARTSGRSKYGLDRTFKVLLDLLTVWFMRGYQTKPIYVFGGAGVLLGVGSVLLAAYVLYQKLSLGIYVHRNPLFILAVIQAIICVQFLMLGLLAEILVRTYFESRQRPSYHIRDRLNFGRRSGVLGQFKDPPWEVVSVGVPGVRDEITHSV